MFAFDHRSVLLKRLIKPAALIHRALGKDQERALGQSRDIIRELIRTPLKESAFLDKDEAPLRKERQGIRRGNDVVFARRLFLKQARIHAVCPEPRKKTGLIIPAEIAFLSAKKIGPRERTAFQCALKFCCTHFFLWKEP